MVLEDKWYVIDHDKKVHEELQPIDSNQENIESIVNMTLNTKVIKSVINHKNIQFHRALSGMVGFRVEREDKVDHYTTQVYHINNMELVTTTRSEHLQAYKELKHHLSCAIITPPTNDVPHLAKISVIDEHDRGDVHITSSVSVQEDLNSEDSTEQLDILMKKAYDNGTSSHEDLIDTYIQKTKALWIQHRESLPEPKRSSISMEDYFFPDFCDTEKTNFHLGRPMRLKEVRKTYKATVWMSQEFPFSIQDLLPLLEIMSPSGKHWTKVKDFIEMRLPPGFPIKIGKSC
jgi:hypothetical protein